MDVFTNKGLEEGKKELEGNNLEDALIKYVCNEYVDEELVQYFKTGFTGTAVQSISEMCSIALEGLSLDDLYVEDILADVLEKRGIKARVVPRFLYTPLTNIKNASSIQRLNEAPDLGQRTNAWYLMRHNLLTATAIAHLFTTVAKCNEVIFEKCQPLNTTPYSISTLDARHWGVRYEPVSRTIYEHMYKTKVKEYSCIQHPVYPFIGASPDGINILERNKKQYGRLIEIKNVVSREITGDPLDDYWIQMQIQMEVCDLDVCDFVETRIKEFATEELFYAERDKHDYCGIVLHFVGLLDPMVNHYEYAPLHSGHFFHRSEVDAYLKRYTHKFRHRYKAQNVLYWYLEEISCVVVERNRPWFQAALPRIESVWNTIVEERSTGAWTLRAPSKRRRQEDDVRSIVLSASTDIKTSGFQLLGREMSMDMI